MVRSHYYNNNPGFSGPDYNYETTNYTITFLADLGNNRLKFFLYQVSDFEYGLRFHSSSHISLLLTDIPYLLTSDSSISSILSTNEIRSHIGSITNSAFSSGAVLANGEQVQTTLIGYKVDSTSSIFHLVFHK